MARQSGIWWWKSRNGYYVGTGVGSAGSIPNKTKATRMWAELIGRNEAPGAEMVVLNLLNLYLDWSEKNHSPRSHQRIRALVLSFGKSLPAGLRVNKLLPLHLTTWMDQRCPKHPTDDSKPVSENTRHDYACDVTGVFNWARKQRIIPASPFQDCKKPAKTPRALVLLPDQWQEVLAHLANDDPFRDFLQVLRNTGCRPQEARIMEARHINFKDRIVRFRDGEVPGKKGDREILLNAEALAILQRCALRCPEGPVLRNTRGRPWKKDSLNCRFQRLKSKLPFRANCYAARHSLATDMLEAGASAGAVAAVLGHKDPTMVLRVYGKHIDTRREHLRACVDKATRKKNTA